MLREMDALKDSQTRVGLEKLEVIDSKNERLE
jgi:hypothetical protein